MAKYLVKRTDNGQTVFKTFDPSRASKFQSRYGSPTKLVVVPVTR